MSYEERIKKLKADYQFYSEGLSKFYRILNPKDVSIYRKIAKWPRDSIQAEENLKILQRLYEKYEPKYEEQQKLDHIRELVTPKEIDREDELGKELTIEAWLNLYVRACENLPREYGESRAVVVNEKLYCNASRALVANGMGRRRSQWDDTLAGKDGDKVYKLIEDEDSDIDANYKGLFCKYATPQELDRMLRPLYGDEWERLKSIQNI